MKVLNKLHDFMYETDIVVDPSFWAPYNRNKWINGNTAYRKQQEAAMGDSKMESFYIQNIRIDDTLINFVNSITDLFGFRSHDFRCTFMRLDPNGTLPDHIDQASKLSIVVPITNNTAINRFQDENLDINVVLKNVCLLNTQKKHGVHKPTEERLTFHCGIHDITWEQLDHDSIFKSR